MSGMSVSGDSGIGDRETCYIMSGLKGLMHNKYGDLILLCGITAAFGLLLVFSAAG